MDIWEQDLWNHTLFKRYTDVYSQRFDIIHPNPNANLDANLKNNIVSNINIRDISLESRLFTLGAPWTHDCPEKFETKDFKKTVLGEKDMTFNNTTKEYYNTVDIRNAYKLCKM